MPRTQVQLNSTVLRSASYDEDTQELDIGFQNGRHYTFYHVPPNVFEGLQTTSSPGNYFNSEIKGRYG